MQNFITINIRIYIMNLILQYRILKKDLKHEIVNEICNTKNETCIFILYHSKYSKEIHFSKIKIMKK